MDNNPIIQCLKTSNSITKIFFDFDNTLIDSIANIIERIDEIQGELIKLTICSMNLTDEHINDLFNYIKANLSLFFVHHQSPLIKLNLDDEQLFIMLKSDKIFYKIQNEFNKESTLDIIRKNLNFESIFQKIYGNEIISSFVITKYREKPIQMKPTIGSLEFLNWVKIMEHSTFILTNRKNMTMIRAKETNIDKYINSSNIYECIPAKPDTTCIRNILNQFSDMSNTTIIIVGDHTTDYQLALNLYNLHDFHHKCYFIGLTTGMSSLDEFNETGKNHEMFHRNNAIFVENFNELISMIPI